MLEPGLSPGVAPEVLVSLGSPAKVETPFGVMEFFDGLPLAGTVKLSYDSLDLLRGIDAYLNCVPGRVDAGHAQRSAQRGGPVECDRLHRPS